MRPERLYFHDIIEAADDIAAFLAGRDEDESLNNKLLRRAVLQALTAIGEAAAHISHDLRARYPEVPWTDVVAFRNFAIHAYFGLDWPTIWRTATQAAPELRQQIAAIVAAEFPADRGRSFP